MLESTLNLSQLLITQTDCMPLNEHSHTLTCVLSMNDVECAIRCPGILEHFGQEHGASRDPFRGLHQVGVATYHTDGEHPEGNHGREVERGNTSTHPDGQAVGVSVHVLGDGR